MMSYETDHHRERGSEAFDPLDLNIIIPLKDLSSGKKRLAPHLNVQQRTTLVQQMFEATVRFFNTHYPQHHITVITASSWAFAKAQYYGATVLHEATSKGLNEAVKEATEYSLQQGYRSQLIVPADIARLDKTEIDQLLNHARAHESLIICPSHDSGTNALLSTPPDIISFHYGAGSSKIFQRKAMARNIPCTILNLPHMAHDIDRYHDLSETERSSYETEINNTEIAS